MFMPYARAVATSASQSRIQQLIEERVKPDADKAGIDLVPHSWLTHLLNGYSRQLIATLPRARYLELNVSQSTLTRGIAQAPFDLAEDGRIQRVDVFIKTTMPR